MIDRIVNLLLNLQKRRIDLWVEQGQLKFQAEKNTLDDETKNKIKENKDELMKFLSLKNEKLSKIIIPTNRAQANASYEQKRFWLASLISSLPHTYNIPCVFLVHGDFSIEKFKEALEETILSMSIFRTKIYQENEELYQEVTSNYVVDINTIEKNLLDQEEIKDFVKEFSDGFVKDRIDLSTPPYLKMTITKFNEKCYGIFILIHHLVADASTIEKFFNQLSSRYNNQSNGENEEISYIDYSLWQSHQAEEDAFWSDYLAERPQKTILPIKDFGINVDSNDHSGKQYVFKLTPSLSEKIKKTSNQLGTNINNFFLTCFLVLLRKYNQSNKMCTAVPGSSRFYATIPDLDKVSGPVINTLPLLVNIDAKEEFPAVLKKVFENYFQCMSHQNKPIEKIHQLLQLDEGSSLFNTSFMMQAHQSETLNFSNCEIENIDVNPHFSKYDLTLSVRDMGHVYSCSLEYKDKIFNKENILTIEQNFIELMQQILENPYQKIGDYSIFSKSHAEIMEEYSHGEKIENEIMDFSEQFNRIADFYGDHPAIRCGDWVVDYNTLRESALKIAGILNRQSKNDIVALVLDRSPMAIICMIAVLLARKTFLPIDKANPIERMQAILNDAMPDVVFVDDDVEGINSINHKVIRVDSLVLEDLQADLIIENNIKKNPAYIIYTSGSTGTPKGVVISHDNFLHYLSWATQKYLNDNISQSLVHSSLAFDLTITSIFAPLMVGKTVIVPLGEGGEVLIDYYQQRLNLGLIKLTPSHLKLLSQSLTEDELKDKTGIIVIGGEALYSQDILPFIKNSPDLILVNEYGPTETTVGCTTYFIEGSEIKHDLSTVPIGRPIQNMTLDILDDNLQACAFGIPGEIYISGKGVGRGYYNNNQLTQEKFIKLGNRSGLAYKTGDLAYRLSDGNMVYLGRIDEQVKINGYRIELGEISSQLLQISGVKAATTLAAHSMLISFAVLETPTTDANDVLMEKLYDRLPTYMIPRKIICIPEMPLTINGKVDQKKLLILLDNEKKIDVKPSNNNEKTLLEIMQRILKVEKLSVSDSFFELGGDSFSAIQISSEAKKQGLVLTVSEIYRWRTIKNIAKNIKMSATSSLPEKMSVGTQLTLPAYEWFLSVPKNNIHHYNQSFVFTLNDQSLDKIQLNNIISDMIREFDSLRLRYNKESYQLYYSTDCDGNYVDETHSTWTEKDLSALQMSLNVYNGPLIRALISPNEQPIKIVIAIHHIACDAVSWGVFINAIEEKIFKRQSISKKSNYTLQSWALECDKNIKNNFFDIEKKYWSKILSELLVCENSLLKNSVDPIQKYNLHYRINETDSSCLINSAAALDLNKEEICLVLLANAFSVTNSNTLPLTLENHGRNNPFNDEDLTSITGWFTTLFPLLIPVNEITPEYIAKVKQVRRAVPHFGMGFGFLASKTENQIEGLSFNKLPRICFNFLGELSDLSSSKNLISHPLWETGPAIDKKTAAFDVEINAFFVNESLNFSINYNEAAVDQEILLQWFQALKRSVAQIKKLCDSIKTSSLNQHLARAGVPVEQHDTLIGSSVQSVHGLSSLQKGLLVNYIKNKEIKKTYVTQLIWDYEGSKTDDQLYQLWQKIVQRHDNLRSYFNTSFYEPIQIILKEFKTPVTYIRLNSKSNDFDKEIQHYLSEERNHINDMIQNVPSKLLIITIDETYKQIIWTHHHILLDGWSARLIKEEMNAQLLDEPQKSSSMQFGDYIRWLNENTYEHSNNIYSLARKLSTYSPVKMPLPVTNEKSTGDVTYALSKALSLRIEALSKQCGLTTNSILQSIWALLLSYYKSTDKITYGLTFSHRPYELDHIADSVGLFINTLPIGLPVDLNSQWLDFAYLLQSENADLIQKASVSLSDLASHVEPYAISDFIDELFVYENMPLNNSKESSSGLKNMRSLETPDVRFVTIIAPGDEYHIRYVFNQVFTSKMIQNWHEIFVHLLEQILDNPQLSIKHISFLTTDHLRTIENFAGTSKHYSYHNIENELVHEYLIHTAALTPNAIAVVDDEGQYSYAELLSAAKKINANLIKAGVKRGERVAVHLERSFYLIAALYGVLMSGGVVIPLEKDNPSTRKSQIIATSRARLVVTDDGIAFEEVETLGLEELLQSGLTEMSWQLDLTSQDLAYIIFTSGSTGMPKGVAISHESAFNLVGPLNEILKLSNTSRVLMFASISFDAAVGDWITSVAQGSCLYISNRKALLHPDDFINYINENQIDTVTLPPSYLSILDESKLKSLKTVISAGEPCPLNVIKTWSQDRNFFNGYGPTETTVFATFSKCVPDQSTVSIGTPAFNKKIYILDQYLRPVPPGVIGEICISGMGIAEGYWDMPELTKEKFIINPFTPQLRMYKTGDLGRWLENGEIDYLGRRDNQLKIRGYRIELEEIKMAMESHPKISQSYISYIEEANEKELVAYYISTENLTDSLVSFLSEKLPNYMLPKYFIKMDKFELTVSGKIDPVRLPTPTRTVENLFLDNIDHDMIFQLGKIFSEQLNVSCATTENYFNYGLHSLLLIKIINEIDKKFNYRVPVKIFYECNTIYDLAKFLSKKIDDVGADIIKNNLNIEEFIL